MADIVERLRAACAYSHPSKTEREFFAFDATNGLVLEAAAEVERLRAALTKINDAAEKGKPTEKLLNWISHIADEAVHVRAVDEQLARDK